MASSYNYGHLHFPVNVGMQAGQTSSATVNSGATADIQVTFPSPFAEAPVVVVGFSTESAAGGFGRCSCAVVGAPSAEGFTLRIYNGDTSGRAPRVTWIAVGTPKG